MESVRAQKDAEEAAATAADQLTATKHRGAQASREYSEAAKQEAQWNKALAAESALASRAHQQLRTSLGQVRSAVSATGLTEASRGVGLLTSTLNPAAAAAALVATTVGFAASSLHRFVAEGDAGRLSTQKQIEAYREASAATAKFSTELDDAKLKLGEFVATKFAPSGFEAGIEVVRRPLARLDLLLGRNTDRTRELEQVLKGLDGGPAARTFAEIERSATASASSVARATADLKARTEATVRAVGAEYDLGQASARTVDAEARVHDAQEKINASLGRGGDQARRLADAERALSEQRQTVADRAQSVVDADKQIAKARVEVTDAQFRSGTGSKKATDAADALQKAEYDAARAHREFGDAQRDLGTREEDVAKTRKANADESKQLAKDLAAAQKDLDGVLRGGAQAQANFNAAVLESGGASLDAKDKLGLFRDALNEIKNGGPAIRTEIDQIAKALGSLPASPFSGTGQAGKASADAAAAALGLALNIPTVRGTPPPAAPDFSGVTSFGPAGGVAPPGLTIVNQHPADPLHIAAESAWRGRI